MTMVHIEERRYVREAFALEFPAIIDPPLLVVQALQGVGWLETGYGRWWKSAEGKTSKNKGAVQHSRPPCDPLKSFQYTDTHPNADGTSTPYHICFRKYVDDVAAWRDVARIAYRQVRIGSQMRRPALEAALANDLYGVSAGMFVQHYYEGWGRTQEERIGHHFKALSSAVVVQAKELVEPATWGPAPEPEAFDDDYLPDNPLILRGSFGPYVKEWQRILNAGAPNETSKLAVDGRFGEHTRAVTIIWQRQHGLNGDGKVGPRTWAAAATEAA